MRNSEPCPYGSAMIRVVLRGAVANLARLVGAVVALALGVAVLVATVQLGSGLRASIAGSVAAGWDHVDVVVAAPHTIGSAVAAETVGIPMDSAEVVRMLDGVDAVATVPRGPASLVDGRGEVIGTAGTAVAETWVGQPSLSPWRLVAGVGATRPGNVVVDATTAEEAGVSIGDPLQVLLPEPLEVVVTGLMRTRTGGSTTVPTVMLSAEDSLVRLVGEDGAADLLLIGAADGVDLEVLVGDVDVAVGSGLDVATGNVYGAALVAGQAGRLGAIDGLLGVMTVISLAVATVGSANVMAVSGARRSREWVFLRSVGARRWQVMVAVTCEHAIVGLVAGGLALPVGMGLAAIGARGTEALDIGVVAPTVTWPGIATIVGTVSVAVLVAVVAGWRTAVRATGRWVLDGVSSAVSAGAVRPRWAVMAVVGLVGVVGGGLAGDPAVIGVASLALLIAVTACITGVAPRLLAGLRRPLIWFSGASGELAWQHTVRGGGRTWGAVTALFVSSVLVAVIAVVASSFQAGVIDRVRASITADLVVQAADYDGSGLPPDLAARLADLDQIDRTASIGLAAGEIGGQQSIATIADGQSLDGLLELDVLAGSLDVPSRWPKAEQPRKAGPSGPRYRWRRPTAHVLNSRSPRFNRSGPGDGVGTAVVPATAWPGDRQGDGDVLVLVGLADGVSVEDARKAAVVIAPPAGVAWVYDPTEFALASAEDIAPVLAVVLALLGLAALSALLVIANTAVLAVIERTREIGLLRAVGQTRRQIRTMVRWESVLVAGVGTTIGMVVGTVVGWATVQSLGGVLADAAAQIPVVAFGGLLAAGLLAGVTASVIPAWHAARIPVLVAIARQ